MDIKDQKDTCGSFKKFATIAGAAVILVLVLMAVFLV